MPPPAAPPLSLNHGLFTPGDRVLVAVSGGTDSLALLHLLSRGREQLGIAVFAAHVHHGMRGEEADADVRFLERTAAAWRVPLVVAHCDVPALAQSRRISVEQAGRDARYDALERLAREQDCGKVATAHHTDDQVETLLLHLFRGAGLDGLRGMPERRPLSRAPGAPELVRPLLAATRAELAAYCRAHALEPRHDRTNDDRRYRRNRIRAELLPVLEAYDAHLREHLLRLAAQAREEAALLRPAAEALLREAEAAVRTGPPRYWSPFPLPETLALQVAVLTQAPPALARRALRIALERFAPVELSSGLVERLLNLAREGSGAVDFPGLPVRAVRAGRDLRIVPAEAGTPEGTGSDVDSSRREEGRSVLGSTILVALPGVTEAPSFGLRLEATEAPAPQSPLTPLNQAWLDAGSLRPPLFLRAPRPGDRFRPLGAPGTRLLSDLFVDRKVPRALRARWPVLCDAEGIVWVVGVAVAERARVTGATTGCVYLVATGPGESFQ